jgi:cation diffusion facilitator family transporter
MNEQQRARIGRRVSAISLATNVLLGAIKAVLGLLSGSIALMADAFHSVSDAGTSLILLLGFRIAAKPPDAQHPFGHGRAEHVSTFLLATILGVAAFEFFKDSAQRIVNPPVLEIPVWVILVLLVTILAKEGLFFYTIRQANRINSEALRADAWHHRSDTLSTVIVILGLAATRLGWPWIDPLAGMGVGIMIAVLSVRLLMRSTSRLLGEAPTRKEVSEIKQEAKQIEGVRGVHEVIIHRYGASQWVSLHVEVPEEVTAGELHRITDEVEKHLESQGFTSVVVHPDPVSVRHPQHAAVRSFLDQYLEREPQIVAFQDLRLMGSGGGRGQIHVDMIVRPGTCSADGNRWRQELAGDLAKMLPGWQAHISIRQAMSALT